MTNETANAVVSCSLAFFTLCAGVFILAMAVVLINQLWKK